MHKEEEHIVNNSRTVCMWQWEYSATTMKVNLGTKSHCQICRVPTYNNRWGQRQIMDWKYILTQHSLNKGLKLHGKLGENATKKELKQLHDMATIQPVDAEMPMEAEKEKAIASLMFFTEKHDGTIKAHACTDGRK